MASHCHFLGNVWLGSKQNATDKKFFDEHHISHVLSITTSLKNSECNTIQQNLFSADQKKEHRIIKLYDVPNEDLLSSIPECITFLETAINSGSGTLIHCDQGVSRSASIVIALIMYRFTVPIQDAVPMLKDVRPIIDPNPGFVRQLHLFWDSGCEIDDLVNHPVHRVWRRECDVVQRYPYFVRSVMDIVGDCK